jgi:putative transposase
MLKDHRPPHIYLDKQFYFLTVRCFEGQPYFKNKQNLVIKTIVKTIKQFNYGIYAWAILDNHFHLLIKVEKEFKKFIQILNGRISFNINEFDKIRKRKVIYQYWDHCIRDEADFYKHFNYIHNNPIKHGIVKNIEELYKYEYSSFNTWLKKKGREWILSSFEEYPILDFTVEGD